MDEIFNNVLAQTSESLTVASTLAAMLLSLLFGMVIAFTYYKTTEEEHYQKSMALTLCMLPIILAVIIVFVGSNIARAFSLAGTLSIIRFRSAPGDPKDIGFIFFDIAAGLACGVGLYGYGAIFVVLLCIVMVILTRTNAFASKNERKALRITIPEDLNYENAFSDILDKYTKNYSLSRVKTTDLGSLFELTYNITIASGAREQELINELRCRNGNLTIMISDAAEVIK